MRYAWKLGQPVSPPQTCCLTALAQSQPLRLVRAQLADDALFTGAAIELGVANPTTRQVKPSTLHTEPSGLQVAIMPHSRTTPWASSHPTPLALSDVTGKTARQFRKSAPLFRINAPGQTGFPVRTLVAQPEYWVRPS